MRRSLLYGTAAPLLTGLLCLLIALPAAAERPLRVVATLSTFADLVEQVGGERVQVTEIASPRFNEHFIEPTPSDVLQLRRADLFVHGGLDLEAWRGPLVNAAGNVHARPGGERELDLSIGVKLLEIPDGPVSRAEGDIHRFGNPHFWLDPANALVMVRRIAEKLAAIDPDHAQDYQKRADDLNAQLRTKIEAWRSGTPAKNALIAYHNQWVYLTEFLGIETAGFLEPKPGIPPTPRHLLSIEALINEQSIRTLVRAPYNPSRPVKSLTKRTAVQDLVLCQAVRALKGCGDYIAMLDYNIDRLNKALSP